MALPFTFALVLFALGLILLSWTPARGDKHPLVMLAGLGLLLVAVVSHLASGAQVGLLFTRLCIDAGLALLIVSTLLAVRGRGGRPFFLLGLLIFGLGVALAFLTPRLAPPSIPAASEATEASLLLELGPDDRIEEVAPLLDRFGARYERAFPALTPADDADLAQYFLVHVARPLLDRLIAALRDDAENVDFAEVNTTVRVAPLVETVPAGPERAGNVLADDPLVARQWGLQAIRAHEAHALLRGVRPVRKAVVAILDTGVDQRHEDLHTVFRQSPGTTDAHGHGTHCAGIAGAVTHNGVGVASLNWEGRFVEVTSYTALPAGGTGTLETIAQAILDATRDGADVISMSLGDIRPTPPRVIAEAVDYALRHGVIVVASAGNAAQDARDHMPSNVEGVIAVAAVDQDLARARFSNTNTSLSRPLAAPGVDILSLKPDGQYVALSGTSMATPMVAGLLGVLRALNPGLTADDAFALLHRTGRPLPASPQVGRLIDAEAALRAVLPPRQVPALVPVEHGR